MNAMGKNCINNTNLECNIYKYISPLGKIVIRSEGEYITDVCIEKQKNFGMFIKYAKEEQNTEIIKKTIRWFDTYFDGKEPSESLNLKLIGSEFQKEVWNLLIKIPYGKLTTYGDIAKIIAERRGIKIMSAQACGNAISSNPISIIIPCHRVIGKNGDLVGYGGGIDLKRKLLTIENVNINKNNRVVY